MSLELSETRTLSFPPLAAAAAGLASASPAGGGHGERWLSLHLFLRDAARPRAAGDGFLLGSLPALLSAGRGAGFFGEAFFIRYAELGHHLRLRLKLAGDPAPGLWALLAEHLALGAAGSDEAGSFVLADHPAIAKVRPIAYAPETERYGGAAALPAAESFFAASSALVLELLRAAAPGAAGGAEIDGERRQALALIAMTVTLRALAGDDRTLAARLALAYRDDVMQVIGKDLLPSPEDCRRGFERGAERQAAALEATVAGFWEALEGGPGELPEPFAEFAAGAFALRDRLAGPLAAGELRAAGKAVSTWTQALAWLSPSYLHMTNNRVGIHLLEECYLGHLLGRLLAPAETAVLHQRTVTES